MSRKASARHDCYDYDDRYDADDGYGDDGYDDDGERVAGGQDPCSPPQGYSYSANLSTVVTGSHVAACFSEDGV